MTPTLGKVVIFFRFISSMTSRTRMARAVLRQLGCVFSLVMVVGSLTACRGDKGEVVTEPTNNGLQTFQGTTFFRIDYPSDWVASDLPDGANLFYTGDVLFVRVKVESVPDPNAIEAQFSDAIRKESLLHGGEASLVRTGERDSFPFRWYLLTKPSGSRLEVILFYNPQLQLLYVIFGSAADASFDEFSRLFETMFNSFQFQISSSHPPDDPEATFKVDLSSPAGAWAAYLEGLWRRDLDILTRSMASINAPRLLNDQAVEEVRRRYYPYNARLLTLVTVQEQGDKVARALVTLRALPPEGYLMRMGREFILEDGNWKVLKFE